MSTRKSTDEKINNVDEQMRLLAEEKKTLQKKKRAEEQEKQKQRLCKRGSVVEKHLPDLAALTDEQFNIFEEKILFIEQTKRIITEILTPQFTPSRSAKSAKEESDIGTATEGNET